ncbi:helix-turn-helix domain-containing protein [Clostridium sp. OF13-4]|uniref:helix-turn-helix domain-containing protein n=1 Tax=Clostridium TaxID=1485 RepID=UPI000E4A416B|nr:MULTISPECIES: helix-turn-helix transcriptional regulator [Clostridium]RGH15962.1 helix-turn-helix domain-containing protein [Clostridium sp. AF12-41]RHV73865.1 helix-turn-helix domain-containing protein [Clostridium sp. OF13-4]
MFDERLKLLRKKHGYTQVSLAETLGVSKGTVAMWETGKRTPDFETLIKLSDLFDVRTDYILGKSNDASSAKLSDDDIEQLSRWELESVYTDLMRLYLSLDSFGQKDVENLIKSEAQRCKEQNTLQDVSNMNVQITIKK